MARFQIIGWRVENSFFSLSLFSFYSVGVLCASQPWLATAEEESSACRFIYFWTAWHFKRGVFFAISSLKCVLWASVCYQSNPAIPQTPFTIVASGPK